MKNKKENNFKFLDWEVYKDSQKIFREVSGIVDNLPRSLRYTIGDQLTKSALSVPLNIAEGSGRDSDKELNRFIDIAIGSAYEAVAALDSLNRMDRISDKKFEKLSKGYTNVVKQLGGFKKTLDC